MPKNEKARTLLPMLRAIMNVFKQAKSGWSGAALTHCGTPRLLELERQARAAGITFEGYRGPDAEPIFYGTVIKNDMSRWYRARSYAPDPPESERQGPRDEGD